MARIAYTDEFNKFWSEIRRIYKSVEMEDGGKALAFKEYKKLDSEFDNGYLLKSASIMRDKYELKKAKGIWQKNWVGVCRWLSREIYLENMECETNDEDDTEHDDWEPVGF